MFHLPKLAMTEKLPSIKTVSYERKYHQQFGFCVGEKIKSDLYDVTICDLVDANLGDYTDVNPLRPTALTSAIIREIDGQYVMYDEQLEANISAVDYLLIRYRQMSADSSKRMSKDEVGYRIADQMTKVNPRKWGYLTPKEFLQVWLQAHREGVLPNEDPVPRSALIAAAVEQELISPNELIENKELTVPGRGKLTLEKGLPNDIYNEIVRQFKSAYGRSPGRAIPITDEDMTFVGVEKEDAPEVFGAFFFTTEPREFETPFDTPREQVDKVWELFKVFLDLNDVGMISETNPHNPPKKRITEGQPEMKKQSTTWYPGASSAPQMYVGARVNDIGRCIARKNNIDLDCWE